MNEKEHKIEEQKVEEKKLKTWDEAINELQAFIIKSKKKELLNAQNSLTQTQQEYEEQKDKYDYKNSNEYNDKYLEYNEGYGEDGDIKIDIQ